MTTTTLLESVISEYLGPPSYSHGNGESLWPCPICGNPRFHTLPHLPQFKDRFKCWGCDFRGDVADFLREQHPDENYNDRLDREEQLYRQFVEQRGVVSAGNTSRGSGSASQNHPDNVEAAFCEFLGFLKYETPEWATGDLAAVRLMAWASAIAEEHHVTLDGLARRCAAECLMAKSM